MKFLLLFPSLVLSFILHAQKCRMNLTDTVTIWELLPFHLQKGYNDHIDANDLLSNQFLNFFCSTIYPNGNTGTIGVYSFKYRVYRKNKLLYDGKNESDYFLRTKLGELMYDLKTGDSLIFFDYVTNVDHLKNVHLLPVSYKIIRNSLQKSDKNELAGYELLGTIQLLQKLFERYPGISGYMGCESEDPKYNRTKTQLSYHYRFLTRDSETQKSIIDYDFTFIYSVDTKRVSVCDNLLGKKFSLDKWIKKYSQSLEK